MLNNQVTLTRYSITDLMYPVGSYYITESYELNTVEKMNAFFGGTWEQIKDCFLWATGDISSITYTENGTSVTKSLTAGSSGGELTHKLTIDEMPSHGHYLMDYNLVTTAYTGTTGWPVTTSATAEVTGGIILPTSTQNAGSSQPHNNMPPYRAVYMYRRTA